MTRPWLLLLLLSPLSAQAAGPADAHPGQSGAGAIEPVPPEAAGGHRQRQERTAALLAGGRPRHDQRRDGTVPRWLEAVRAQRRALQQQHQAAHEARRQALDPVGSAQREARRERFLQRRQERRELIESERRRYWNSGPWLDPLPSPARPPLAGPGSPAPEEPAQPAPDRERQAMPPPDWDNLWYYRGW